MFTRKEDVCGCCILGVCLFQNVWTFVTPINITVGDTVSISWTENVKPSNVPNAYQIPVPVAARSAAARLLRSWVRIPPGAWMFVCCEYCVLSGRGICDELFTHPEESYRLWCVVVCDLETSRMRRPWPALGRSATRGRGSLLDAFQSQSATRLKSIDRAIYVDWFLSEVSYRAVSPLVSGKKR